MIGSEDSLHVLQKFQQIKTGNHLEYVSSFLSQNSHLIYIQQINKCSSLGDWEASFVIIILSYKFGQT